jgi:predicted aspartyl protease
MALGPVDSRNVPAMVAERDLPVSLVGQSFLRRVGSLEISGDELRLR